jgi:MFS family permease
MAPGVPPPRPSGTAPVPARRPARHTAQPRQELRQRALAAAIFGLLGLLALSAANQVAHPSYLVAFALAIGIVACVLGATAARRARREETARPRGSVAGIVLGGVSIGLALLAFVAITFSRQLTDYQQCMDNARSATAQQTCTHQLLQSVRSQYAGKG